MWRAVIAFDSKDDSLVQQVPAACVAPAFGDPPIVRPVDHATTGCDLDGEPSATSPADQAKQEAQNQAKNEFCAWQNTDPALVTRFSLDQLQSVYRPVFHGALDRIYLPRKNEKRSASSTRHPRGTRSAKDLYVQLALYLLEGHASQNTLRKISARRKASGPTSVDSMTIRSSPRKTFRSAPEPAAG